VSAPSVAVVGCGLIGGSLLRALSDRKLIAIDRDRATLASIQSATTSDKIADAAEADIIVLALPVPALLASFDELARALKSKSAIVTDVAGIKQPVMDAAGSLPSGIKFVGGHPMAGSERSGFGASNPDLFRDRTVALCTPSGSEEAAVAVEAMWQSVGARIIRCSASEHDAAVARISHLPYLVAASLARVAGKGDQLSRTLAAGGLRDTTRVAEDATIRFALERNPHVAPLAREVAEELRVLADALERGDSVHSILDEAAAARRSIFKS
jgi:prephenate dehydrogenase